MASITSAQSGLSTATSTWTGGVVPVVGDKVTIAAGHTVTLAGTHHWGDDTSTGITVNGTLKASRTVSSQLTCRGDLYVNQLVGGTLDLGTEADPMPAGVTTTIILNNSAEMGHNKWGIRNNEAAGAWTGGISIWGAYKKPYCFLTEPAGANDVTFSVDDATGWQLGDVIGFQPPTGNVIRYRVITGIARTGGSSANVTVGASLSRASTVGNGVLNISRNVRIVGYQGDTWRSHISLRIGASSTGSNRVELGPCEIVLSGGSASTWMMCGLNIHHESNSTLAKLVRRIAGPVVSRVHSVSGSTETYLASGSGAWNFFTGQGAPLLAESIFAASATALATQVQLYNGTSVEIGPESVLLGGNTGINSGYSQGAVACSFKGRMWGVATFVVGAGISVKFDGAALEGYNSSSLLAGGMLQMDNCKFGLNGEPTSVVNSFNFQNACLFPTVVKNPSVGAKFGVHRANSNLANSHPSNYTDILQINGDPAANERYVKGGKVSRDGTRTRRSTGSICLASWYSQNVLSMPLSTKVAAGATLRIKGSVWIEASYLPGDAPSISLTGTGLTTVNWSAPAVAGQWHEFDLQIVNTNAYPTDVAITLTARSNANTETARVWVDGIFSDPWSGNIRHHGFQWLAQTALVADTRITLTEAAALALPVVVDHVAGTITKTGALTARQVFEACMADLAQTANQGRAVHITSATGESFETTYTVTGPGVISGAYQDAVGRHVTISAPALIAGSRVQLYDMTAGTELYNGVLAATGLLLPVVWSADHTIRLRAEHADKLALQTVGVLSSSGLTFLDVQADDTVYTGNGIDGSTCTEFAADGPNVQVDINDPDGVTSVQRLYAWAQWYQTTAAGIASQFFGAVQAIDAATYVIDQALADIHLDNVQATPVRVVGGYLARKDGSTVIATGSGSIQMDPGKAYVAGVDGLARESTVQAVLGLSLEKMAP